MASKHPVDRCTPSFEISAIVMPNNEVNQRRPERCTVPPGKPAMRYSIPPQAIVNAAEETATRGDCISAQQHNLSAGYISSYWSPSIAVIHASLRRHLHTAVYYPICRIHPQLMETINCISHTASQHSNVPHLQQLVLTDCKPIS